MAWQSKTLGEIVPLAVEAANAVIVEADAGLTRLNEGKAAVQEALNEARNAMNAALAELEKLKATGFAVIMLSPGRGSWSTRLVNAPNAPSTDSGLYSCGYFNILTATTLTAAEAAFAAMKKALTEKPEIPEFKLELTFPEANEPDLKPDFSLDVWHGLTLGELMPGAFNAAKAVFEAKKAIFDQINKTMDTIDKKIRLLADAKSEASAFISGLADSGLYQYAMGPAVGSWIARAAAETGAPSTFADQYCFGFAAVAVASDLAGCQALYAKLQAVM